jgi:hypothetical protein
MTGYSTRPLVAKLGLKPGNRAWLIHAPEGYLAQLAPLPPGVEWVVAGEPGLDFVQLFVQTRADLAAEWPAAQGALAPAGMLWVSWPKRGSGLPTDLTENAIREFGLAQGLVDVKVCAVDAVWSGLKFVYRLRDRPIP